MGRIRSVKPEVFLHEDLFDLEVRTGLPIRLAWIGLWTQCCREGRFPWRPRQLKAAILPHDVLEFSRVLEALLAATFVISYRDAGGQRWGYIPTWEKHQFINNREGATTYPDPTECQIDAGSDTTATGAPRVEDVCAKERKGRERKGREGNSISGEPSAGTPLIVVPGVVFLTNDKREWHCPQYLADRFATTYPAVNVPLELQAAALWLETNPAKRKTCNGMGAFLRNWMERNQNRGGSRSGPLFDNPTGPPRRTKYQLPDNLVSP